MVDAVLVWYSDERVVSASRDCRCVLQPPASYPCGHTPPPSPHAARARAAPPVQYDIVSTQALVGMALMRAGAGVIDGYSTLSEEALEFRPPPALVDDKGIRIALKDGRHETRTVATLQVALTMHVAAALQAAAQ